jgi:hypothetical protein
LNNPRQTSQGQTLTDFAQESETKGKMFYTFAAKVGTETSFTSKAVSSVNIFNYNT